MEAPKLPSFIKLPRHKKFEYKPLYFDARKEALEERIKKIKREMEEDKNVDPKDRIKREIEKKWQRNNYKQQINFSNIRIFVIFCVLVGIMYYLLKY
jgi:hypothetical protein